jgi:hypothetical protein
VNDPIQNLLVLGALKVNPFPPNSRYADTPVAVLETPGERSIVHLRRRFVPPPERFALLQEHTVVQGDRPDTLAARLIGDPELYWRLCDANGVMRPCELTGTPGRKLRVTLPEGIPGGAGG